MDLNTVKSALIDAIEEVQTMGGYSMPSGVSDGFCPMRDLDGFDSFNVLEVGMGVSARLGYEISGEIKMFGSANNPRSLDEIADEICKQINVAQEA